jgi:hypothetical protein
MAKSVVTKRTVAGHGYKHVVVTMKTLRTFKSKKGQPATDPHMDVVIFYGPAIKEKEE